MVKLTKNDIISLALESAAQLRLPPDQLQAFDNMYELMKESLLKERPWLFTLTLSKDLTETTEGGNRGFRYKYTLPKDCVQILTLNPSQSYITLSPEQARGIGISIDPYAVRNAAIAPKYIFVNNVLHTDVRVTEVLYKKDAPEAEWPGDFSLALMWKLASYIASTRSQDPAVVNRCNKQSREYHLKALRPIQEVGPVPVTEKALQHWLLLYYNGLYQQGY